MKDDLDNETKELDLPVKKKAGRPSRQVTRRNFFDLRDYFDKKYRGRSDDAKDKEFRSLVRELPYREITQTQIDREIASSEKHISDLEYSEREIPEYVFDGLKEWKAQQPELLTAEHISAFQAWVDKHISEGKWGDILAVIRQKRHKQGNGDYNEWIKQISVKMNTFKRLEELKDEMGSANWDYAMSKMVTLSREALKTRATKKRAAEKRRITMTRR